MTALKAEGNDKDCVYNLQNRAIWDKNVSWFEFFRLMSVYTVCILDPETTLAINSFFMLKVFRNFLSGEIEICGSDFSINTCIAPFPSSQNKLIFSL